MEIAAKILFLMVLLITLAAAISDARTMRIPNSYPLIIIALFPIAYFLYQDGFNPLWQHISATGAVFIITYIMFCFRVMGGGDAKLATAISLWLGVMGSLGFLLYMSIAGGFLGFFSILIKKYKPFKSLAEGSWLYRVQSGENAIAYGIAIFIGLVASILHTSYTLTLF